MSIPSITIRIEFQEGGVGALSSVAVQGQAPAPVDWGTAGVQGASSPGGLPPSPSASFTASAAGAAPPSPMTGGAFSSAAVDTPPKPSDDVTRLAAERGGDQPPKPEGEPKGTTRARRTPRR